ncbi:hypothetical protein KTC96_24635 (plasmid) [Clostridium estertheticum]|uniref:hypothetical protein n=1 Tax=Clostridium estertheticum TaxID=238834 RepID=UPI001C7CF2F9|nr:hypothetical protein [Clostridium estertheticum]MBX4259715.1 hypothetical protein [Clostridium estertheticum]WLC73302.1 hypothetical protein KTC96_24635 [Clostridium estertheticum]
MKFIKWIKEMYEDNILIGIITLAFAIYGLIDIMFKIAEPIKKITMLFLKNKFWSDLNTIATNNVLITSIVTSLIAAVIFYLVFEWVPLRIKNKRVLPYVVIILNNIETSIMCIFQEILDANHPSIQHDIRVGKITEAMLIQSLKNSYFNSDEVILDDTKAKIIGERIYNSIITIENNCHEVLNYIQFLDATTLEYINKIIGFDHHKSIKNKIEHNPGKTFQINGLNGLFAMAKVSMSGWSKPFYDEYLLFLSFKKHLIKKYSWSISILMNYETDLRLEGKYKRCIKICKKAIKARSKQKSYSSLGDGFERTNIFYCLYCINRKKSYKYLKKYFKRKLISFEDLRDRVEYADISSDEYIINIIMK